MLSVFIGMLVICMSSFVNCLFKALPILLNHLIILSYSSYILNTITCHIFSLQIFSPFYLSLAFLSPILSSPRREGFYLLRPNVSFFFLFFSIFFCILSEKIINFSKSHKFYFICSSKIL